MNPILFLFSMTKNALELLVEMYPNKNWWQCGISKNPLITMDLIKKMGNNLREGENGFNWEELSQNSGITMEIICEYIDKPWDFSCVSINPNLTIEMIQKFPYQKWNWEYISRNPAFKMDTIESNLDLPWNWEAISRNPNLTPEFIEKYFREFTEQGSAYSNYGFCEKINLDMVEKNLELNWNWRGISANSGLTIPFIRKYRNYENGNGPHWSVISISYKLDWGIISKNPVITFEIMQENDDLPWDYNGFSQNPNLKIDNVKNNMSYGWNWHTISNNVGISEEDIENNPNLPWDYSWVINNPNVSIEFLEKHIDKLDSRDLSKCPKLTFDFIKKYHNDRSKIDFSLLSTNPLTFENEILKERSRVKSSEEILVLNIIKPYQNKIDELTRENKRLNFLFTQFKNLISPIQKVNPVEYKYTPTIPKKRYIGKIFSDDSGYRRIIPLKISSKQKSIVYNVNSDFDDDDYDEDMEMVD